MHENLIVWNTHKDLEKPNQTYKFSKINSSRAANMDLIIKDALLDLHDSKEIQIHKSNHWDHNFASYILLINLLARDFKFDITTSSRKSKSQPKNKIQDFENKKTRGYTPNKWKRFHLKMIQTSLKIQVLNKLNNTPL